MNHFETDTDLDTRERELRRDLAAAMRVAARQGWCEQIGTHFSLMLPSRAETPDRFLITPRGLLPQEVTASSLIVCDLNGTVMAGRPELRPQDVLIHAAIHLRHPAADCVMHVHPQYLTSLGLLAAPELALAHHNNLTLNDRVKIDQAGLSPATDAAEAARIATALDGATILILAGHGVTVTGPTVADAFDELYTAERTAMYQMTAMASGQKLRTLPQYKRRNWRGAWGEKSDASLHLAAWRRVLDREEPDYRS